MSAQDNIVKVEYNGRKYNVNVNVENDLSIDLKNPELDENALDISAEQAGIPSYPPPAAPADESVQGNEPDNQGGVTAEMTDMLGGRKLRRTNRRGPGRPRKTRRYRRRSIRK